MKSALLIIDMQRGLVDDEPRPFEIDAVVDRINAVAARARATGLPVVHIQHEYTTGRLVYGADAWQLERRLVTQAGDLFVRKTTPDSFLRTDLEALLSARGVEHVYICGFASEFCVDTTTRCAAALGYPVTLIADAHTTHDKPHATAAQIRAHENATLPDIGSFGPLIQALPADQVIFAGDDHDTAVEL